MVGGLAVVLHGHARVTGDMNIWVKCSAENYKKLVKAFHQFHMPVFDMTLEKFLQVNESDVFSFGRNPVGIVIMTAVKGLNFHEAYKLSLFFNNEGLPIRLIHINQLIEAKKAAGRLKDIDDIQQLQKVKISNGLGSNRYCPAFISCIFNKTIQEYRFIMPSGIKWLPS